MHAPTSYSAILSAPFAALGVRLMDGRLVGLDFLPPESAPSVAFDALADRVRVALSAYWDDPAYRFDLPLAPQGSPYRLKVWQALLDIPSGETVTYAVLARRIGSSARAVGQALGDNPLPIVIPCHRVVAASGLGGFNHARSGYSLDIKRWLLKHEGGL